MTLLSKEQLKDKTRYQFKAKEVDIPELGGSVKIKTLSVRERNELPELVEIDSEGRVKSIATVEDLAKTFATLVSEPKLTVDEAKEVVGDLPAPAYDRVQQKFAELLGTEDDKKSGDSGVSSSGD